jgi:hypothetical protein
MPGSRMFSPQCGTGMQGVYAAARIISMSSTARLPHLRCRRATIRAVLLIRPKADRVQLGRLIPAGQLILACRAPSRWIAGSPASPCEALQPAETLGVRLSEARGAIGARACGQGPRGAVVVPVAIGQSTRKPGIAVQCILRSARFRSISFRWCRTPLRGVTAVTYRLRNRAFVLSPHQPIVVPSSHKQ